VSRGQAAGIARGATVDVGDVTTRFLLYGLLPDCRRPLSPGCPAGIGPASGVCVLPYGEESLRRRRAIRREKAASPGRQGRRAAGKGS
jgi:hypothetical protein